MFRSEFRAHRGYWMTLALVSAGIIGSAIGAHTVPSNGQAQGPARIAACTEFADRSDVPGSVPGVCGLAGTDRWDSIDTAGYGTDVPRCASDDYNADRVARCFTQRVTDGAVLLLDARDEVIATFGQ